MFEDMLAKMLIVIRENKIRNGIGCYISTIIGTPRDAVMAVVKIKVIALPAYWVGTEVAIKTNMALKHPPTP